LVGYGKNITSANQNEKAITDKIDELWTKFQAENQIPKELMKAPEYDPTTGKPKDSNYEFFHRFVANNAAEATTANVNTTADYDFQEKPFFWATPTFEKKLIPTSHLKMKCQQCQGTLVSPNLAPSAKRKQWYRWDNDSNI
jgi:hypothetical protein